MPIDDFSADDVVALDDFRRKKVVDEDHTCTPALTDAVGRSLPSSPLGKLETTRKRTELRVSAAQEAIRALAAAERNEIASTNSPKAYRIRFCAAMVARAAGIGRTQLYVGEPKLREAIAATRAELEQTLETRRGARRSRTKVSLEDEISRLVREHRAEIQRLASTQLSDLINQFGPHIEAAQRASNETASLREQISRLANQVEARDQLILQLERATKTRGTGR